MHDKGKKNGLGRFIRVFSFFNKFGEVDPNLANWSQFDEGVLSIKIDADAVNSKDDDLIYFFKNTSLSIMPYLKILNVERIKIVSFTSDARKVVNEQEKRVHTNSRMHSVEHIKSYLLLHVHCIPIPILLENRGW